MVNKMTEKINIIIISPVRNEAKNIEKTILSVISQTIKPLIWIIVDDGSTDGTDIILKNYLIQYPWIKLLTLPDRGYYDLITGGEIKAFYRGFEVVKDLDFDYLSKLDGDISFDKHYYENLISKFEQNTKLGIASGSCYQIENNEMILEKVYEKHVRGAARIYRKLCWDDIGGVIDDLGWDAIDVYKARMVGWETMSFEDIKMIHHVKTWTKGGLLHGRHRSGRMEYLIGTHPLFFFLKVLRELTKKPFVISCFAFVTGYIKATLKNEERVVDHKLMKHIRQEQISRIVFWR